MTLTSKEIEDRLVRVRKNRAARVFIMARSMDLTVEKISSKSGLNRNTVSNALSGKKPTTEKTMSQILHVMQNEGADISEFL